MGNAPGTFQWCMMFIFSVIVEDSIEVFIYDFSVVGQSSLEWITNHRKIIYKNFYCFLHHIRKYWHHTSLKCGRCIAQPKRHSFERKGPIWTSKSGFLLIFWCNRNLIISIKKTVPPFSGKSIQHLIHEGHRKMVFFNPWVQFTVIHTHPTSSYRSYWNKFISFDGGPQSFPLY